MTKLFIVESPTKIKKIRSFLGRDFTVLATVGHFRDLPDHAGVVINGDRIEPHYEVTSSGKRPLEAIRKAAKGRCEVYLATDPDREGEAIAWHVTEALGPRHRYFRVTFHAVTKEAVQTAVATPGTLNQDLVDAQQARRILDRIVGYLVSPILKSGTGDPGARSAGRVQSVALRIVVDREREILNFRAVTYGALDAHFEKDGIAFKAPLTAIGDRAVHHDTTVSEVQALAEAINDDEFAIDSVVEKQRKRKPKPPFDTSSLQQAASVVLKLAPRATMDACKELFEGGFITYPRTDSFLLDPSAVAGARTLIAERYPPAYLPEREPRFASKGGQEAHEAIRPTDWHREALGGSCGLSDDARHLYELIWIRFIASQMAPGLDRHIMAVLNPNSRPDLQFTAKGTAVVFDGWRRILTASEDDEREGGDPALPPLAEGERLRPVAIKAESRQTKPPARFTAAQLIRVLEKAGVGRPSTYASILETLLGRGYVVEQRRKLVPTATGSRVTAFLLEHFAQSFMDLTFTAELEAQLDAIAGGAGVWCRLVQDQYQALLKRCTQLGLPASPFAPPERICPKCRAPLTFRSGTSKRGPWAFWGCRRYPKCKFKEDTEPSAA